MFSGFQRAIGCSPSTHPEGGVCCQWLARMNHIATCRGVDLSMPIHVSHRRAQSSLEFCLHETAISPPSHHSTVSSMVFVVSSGPSTTVLKLQRHDGHVSPLATCSSLDAKVEALGTDNGGVCVNWLARYVISSSSNPGCQARRHCVHAPLIRP